MDMHAQYSSNYQSAYMLAKDLYKQKGDSVICKTAVMEAG